MVNPIDTGKFKLPCTANTSIVLESVILLRQDTDPLTKIKLAYCTSNKENIAFKLT